MNSSRSLTGGYFLQQMLFNSLPFSLEIIMTTHLVDDLRNIVLVGRGATGKTSLADLMLYKAGVNRRIGSPDEGTSLLDIDEDEKQRHHSITSHLCHFEHNGARLNLIDAPGMPDFVGQVLGAFRAAETVLITLHASHGIENDARKAFRQAGDEGLSRWIVLNKCDAENVHLPELMQELREQFGPACALMTIPLGTGSHIRGVLEVASLPDDIPDDVAVDANIAYQQLLDAIAESDEELMMRYLDGETLTREEMESAIINAIVAGTLIPVFCTAVKQDFGVSELMTAIARYAPNPHQVRHHVLQDGEDIEYDADPDGPLVAQVIKTRIDPFLSKISYVRIYSGQLKKESNVHVVGSSRTVRIHQIADVQGGQYQPIDVASAGELVAITKLDDLHTGDVLSSGSDSITLPPIEFPHPMIGVAVEPRSQSDQAKISSALNKIREEDPTFRVYREEQTHEIVMQGMSELHLQLIQNRLHQRDKVDVITHAPKVPYRETVQGVAEGSYRHKKQSGGSGQFAEVHMRVSPCPAGVVPEEYFTKENFPNLRTYHYDPVLNSCFIDRVSGGSVPNQFIPAVEKGVHERMTQGGIAGCQMQDLVVELFFGKDHPVDSNEMAFKIAANHCLKEIFLLARPALLEPIVKAEITVPSGRIGEITGDLNSRRGRMEGMEEISGGFTVIQAKVPLSEMMTYARSLSSMTAGQGTFTIEFANYEPVPGYEQQKIIASHQYPSNGNGMAK